MVAEVVGRGPGDGRLGNGKTRHSALPWGEGNYEGERKRKRKRKRKRTRTRKKLKTTTHTHTHHQVVLEKGSIPRLPFHLPLEMRATAVAEGEVEAACKLNRRADVGREIVDSTLLVLDSGDVTTPAQAILRGNSMAMTRLRSLFYFDQGRCCWVRIDRIWGGGKKRRGKGVAQIEERNEASNATPITETSISSSVPTNAAEASTLFQAQADEIRRLRRALARLRADNGDLELELEGGTAATEERGKGDDEEGEGKGSQADGGNVERANGEDPDVTHRAHSKETFKVARGVLGALLIASFVVPWGIQVRPLSKAKMTFAPAGLPPSIDMKTSHLVSRPYSTLTSLPFRSL